MQDCPTRKEGVQLMLRRLLSAAGAAALLLAFTAGGTVLPVVIKTLVLERN